MRYIFIIALLLFLFNTPCVCAQDTEPIKIGLSLGLTGKYSEICNSHIKGFKLWEKDVNERGGILGRKVKLIVYDDKSDSETAKSLYENLITKDKVDLVFTPYSSELTEAILPIIEKHGYPTIATGAASDVLWEKGYRYLFGLSTPASRYAAGFLETLALHNIKNIAIIYANDKFSKSIADGTKQWAEKFGLRVLMFSEFEKGKKDFSEILKKAKGSHVSALLACGHFDEAVNVRLSLKKIKWYPKAYYASIGPSVQAFYDRLGSDADYTFSSTMWEYHTKLPGSKKFYEDFVNAYGKEPSYQAATAYAGGEILEKAIKKAKNLDKKKLREMLSAMETMTIIGRYGVDKTGKQIKHFPLIMQWQNNKKEIVWPEDLRTAKPIFK